MSCDQTLSSCCCCDFPVMMACILELWAKTSPFSLKLFLPDYFIIATEENDICFLICPHFGDKTFGDSLRSHRQSPELRNCAQYVFSKYQCSWEDRLKMWELYSPPPHAASLSSYSETTARKKSRAPRQSGESEVSSQSTGHIPNFPLSQKQNEIQIALPKPWDALPNSGNHHHQVRPKSQNMPGGRSLSPFYKDLSPNILCPQTHFQNLPYFCPRLQWSLVTTFSPCLECKRILLPLFA